MLQAFEAIAEAAARVLDVDSVCIWQYRPDSGFICVLAHERASDAHDGGIFEEGPALAAIAVHHPAPSSLPSPKSPAAGPATEHPSGTWTYAGMVGVPPHALSLMETQICVDGELYGAVVYEATDPAREWRPDEIAFADEMRDFLARAVQNERHRRAEVRLDYLQLHDPLTGLANRTLMLGAINDLLRRQCKRPRLAALLFISLDRFYGVNEIAGEAGGDMMLHEVGERINAVTPDEAIVARVESDCFAVLMPWLAQEWQAHKQAEDILAEISRPLKLEQVEFSVSASIGIAFNPGDMHTTADELLRDADLASKQALTRGRNRCEVFDSEQHRGLLDRLLIEQNLRDALHNDTLEVVYQPELDLATGKIVAAEALLRWRDAEGVLRAASDFIDVAESSGLIVPIGRWVLHRACSDANEWPAAPDGEVCALAVNLSARQFEQPGLVEMVTEVLRDTSFDPQRLCLEITETVLMSRAGSALQTLQALKALGISLAMDDFGTGYSSLAYLKRFPVDTLKIDKSLIDDFPGDPHAYAIVSAVVALANALELEVVVEGVEQLTQETALRAMGCHRVQGWLYARGDSHVALIAQLQQQGCGPVPLAP
ncbi:putative bifunctional diguanylate cyclase/phosphodiesterase [Rhodanobacter ginsengiterrae]|uniref:putative bifunctional diguanylate cyclase/phosphodiesterase n=1 Tax=Rhodanobacter ginsengiterrae TaxID=2008451 RepID=UPI003CF1A35C